ncbi:hypothetical protein [Streptomyces sp. NBRC 109706]|uniref:hypothetical protein n=1 Tax=Streptomyces sp. NBRC 109706 TaxID=1550035 RepID=UPI0007837EBE|nr:hypothetical protein [Streptomyces sp. NBRC 109706]
MTTLAPCCTACYRPLPAWDLDRLACPGCQSRAAERLAELPALLAALSPVPTRTGGLVAVHGPAGSRPPIALHAVDLSVEVPALLDSWARDWASVAGHDLPERWLPNAAAGPALWLRWRLDWACRQHPAVEEALREIGHAWSAVRTAALGERAERRVAVVCPCQGLLRVGVSTDAATCAGCGTRWSRGDLLGMPLAQRSAA